MSAFAFQGTNAHVILEQSAGGSGGPDTQATVAWQRDFLWVAPQPHTMLHRAAAASRSVLLLECQLSATPGLAYIWDHRVGGKAIFPGAAFLELAAAAVKLCTARASSDAALRGITIPAPLQLPDQMADGRVALRCAIQPASGSLQIASSASAFKQPHITGTAGAVIGIASPLEARALLRTIVLGQSTFEPGLPASHAAIDNSAAVNGDYFHPATLDSCLQLAAADASSGLKVPAGLEAAAIPAPLVSPQLWAASRELSKALPSEPSSVDYWLSAACGGSELTINALAMKPMAQPRPKAAAASAAAAEEIMYEVDWPVVELATAAGALASGMASLQLTGKSGAPGTALAASAIAALQQALPASGGAIVITSSVQPQAAGTSTGQAAQPAGALPGLMRTVALEHQAQRFGTVDQDAFAVSEDASARMVLLQAGVQPSADQYGTAVRAGRLHAAAMLPSKTNGASLPFHLLPQPRGAITSLTPVPASIDAVAPDSVLLLVKAVGINFRCGSCFFTCSAPCFCQLVLSDALLAGAGTCSMCWACTLETPARLALTARVWSSGSGRV